MEETPKPKGETHRRLKVTCESDSHSSSSFNHSKLQTDREVYETALVKINALDDLS